MIKTRFPINSNEQLIDHTECSSDTVRIGVMYPTRDQNISFFISTSAVLVQGIITAIRPDYEALNLGPKYGLSQGLYQRCM